MEAPNIKAKPEETTEEVDRRHNSRCREELGSFGSGSGGLEGQRRGLHEGRPRGLPRLGKGGECPVKADTYVERYIGGSLFC